MRLNIVFLIIIIYAVCSSHGQKMHFYEEKPMLQFWEIGECSVVTDTEKYMWIGTREHGLIRYDGQQMLRF